jgi:hypothetical protein
MCHAQYSAVGIVEKWFDLGHDRFNFEFLMLPFNFMVSLP